LSNNFNIYENKQYDTLPNYIGWTTNNLEYSSPIKVKSCDFQYFFKPAIEKKNYDFKTEMNNAIALLAEQSKDFPIALCISGGVDSEIIARLLKKKSIYFELFFLSNWNLNDKVLVEFVQPLAHELNVKLHIIHLNHHFFKEQYVPESFFKYGCHFPTYIALTYLFSQIPENYFIVVGEGDLEKKGVAYEKLYLKKSLAGPINQTFIPIMINEIFYRLWSQENQRHGQFYFYNSTPELVASMWTNPHFKKNFPFYATKQALNEIYPEIKYRNKSTNWEDDLLNQRKDIINFLWTEKAQHPHFDFWDKHMGCFTSVDSIFYT
jgi:hypothetical protein